MSRSRALVVGMAAGACIAGQCGSALAASAAPASAKLSDKVATVGHPAAGQSAQFKLSETTPKGDSVASFTLNYGDHSKVVRGEKVPNKETHTFTKAGHYTLTLTVTDKHHHSAKATDKITVGPAPTITPLATNSSGLLLGNASPQFPAGVQGRVDVVSVGALTVDPDGSGDLPLAIRNNTSKAVSHIDLSAVARDTGGNVAATGSSVTTVPAQLAPGALGFADIYFQGTAPPAGASYSFSATTDPADTSSFNTASVKITDADLVGGNIVGAGINTTGEELQGPYAVDAFCFGSDGGLTAGEGTYADEDGNLPAAGTISFSIDLYGASCSSYLVGAAGYFA